MILSKIDWIKIRNDYINGNISYRKLAEKYGISFNTLKDRAVKENWYKEKLKQHEKIRIKTQQKTAEKKAVSEADRITRLLNISDKLLNKLDQATDELGQVLIKNKEKTKIEGFIIDEETGIKYDKIVNWEYEKVDKAETIIDRFGVKLLAAALKDILTVISSNRSDEAALEKLDEILKGISENATK